MADRLDRTRVWAIAMREFRQTVFTRGFFMAVVVTPIGGSLITTLASGFAMTAMAPEKPAPVVGELVVVDPTGFVGPVIAERYSPDAMRALEAAKSELVADLVGSTVGERAPAWVTDAVRSFDPDGEVRLDVKTVGAEADVEALQASVERGATVGLVVVPPELTNAPPEPTASYRLVTREGTPDRVIADLADVVRGAVVTARITRAGQDPATVRALVEEPPRWRPPDETPDLRAVATESLAVIGPMGFVSLVWFTSFLAGNLLTVATIEEKSSKVIEVLLGAVTPVELLAGKLVGYGFVAAIVAAVYGGAGIAAVTLFAGGLALPWYQVPALIVCFVLAYLTEATLMATVGAAVDDLREAQTLMAPMVTVSITSMMLALGVAGAPDSTMAMVLSFVPPFVPYAVAARLLGGGVVPGWHLALAFVVSVASLTLALRLTANVFRIGLLTQGRTPTLREIARWARDG